MGEPEAIDDKIELSEGEPHPAEMLASLLKGESGAARWPIGSAQATGEETAATQPAPSAPPPARMETPRIEEVPPAARALAAQHADETAQELSGLLRTIRAFRSALPLVQRLLPLLDGNVVAAITNVLAPRPQAAPAQKPVDMAPMESSLAELKAQHQELRNRVQEQGTSMQRITDQMERVRELTDRNSDELEELVEELKAAGKKMNIVAFLAFALLAASIALNVVLYLQFHHLMP